MNDETNKGGRPPTYLNQLEPLFIQSSRLTLWHLRAARRLGAGNVSVGIRLALEIACENSSDTIKKPIKNA